MGLPQLDQSLCGCTLRTGSKIIGWFVVIAGILEILILVAAAIGISTVDKIDDDAKKVIEIISIVTAVLVFLMVVVSGFMLAGVYKEKPSWIYPWIVVQIIGIVLLLLGAIFSLFSFGPNAGAARNIVSSIISIYFVLIVNSYYVELKTGQGGNMHC